MLLVDVSGSRKFGAVGIEKREMIAEISATIAFSAIQNNDKVGVIFFSDKIEKFIPPKKGKKHILFIIRELLVFNPESSGTDIALALKYYSDALKRRCTTFLISDFIDSNDFSQALRIANNKHDLMAIQVYDKRESVLPNVGLLKVKDLETNEILWVDSSSKQVRNLYSKSWYEHQQQLSLLLQKSKIDVASIATDEDFVKALRGLLQNRSYR